METEMIFDKEVLSDILDYDNDSYMQIINLFLEETPNRIRRLEQALFEKDTNLVLHEAHSINGSAGNIGALALQKAALQLELSAGKKKLNGSKNQIQQIHIEYEQLKIIIDKDVLKN